MSFVPDAPTVHHLLAHCERTLLQTWRSTGFGQLVLESSQSNPHTVQIVLRGTTHHHYAINQPEMAAVLQQASTHYPFQIDNEMMQRLEATLLEIWRETGFGQVTIDSERINNDKIRVIFRGSTFYRYVIPPADRDRWHLRTTCRDFPSSGHCS